MTTQPECPCCGQQIQSLDIIVNVDGSTVLCGGSAVYLTRQEMVVFNSLFKAYPRVVTREKIFNDIYPLHQTGCQKIIDVLICKLRRKLAPLGIVIATNWGCGYSIERTSELLNSALTEARVVKNFQWSGEHDRALKNLLERKFTPQQIAAQMRMPYLTINRAMTRLGLARAAA